VALGIPTALEVVDQLLSAAPVDNLAVAAVGVVAIMVLKLLAGGLAVFAVGDLAATALKPLVAMRMLSMKWAEPAEAYWKLYASMVLPVPACDEVLRG